MGSSWMVLLFWCGVITLVLAQQGISAPSVRSVVDSYISALTTGGFKGFFDYNASFRQEAAQLMQETPQALWDQRLGALRAEWRRRLDASVGVIQGDAAWDYLYERSVQASVIEVRQVDSGSASVDPDATAWHAFVKVMYPVEAQAPLFGARRIKEVILRVPVVSFPPGRGRWLVGFHVEHGGTSTVEGTRILWPLQQLSKSAAERMLADAVPLPLMGTGKLFPTVNLHSNVTHEGPRERVDRFLGILQQFGFAWESVGPRSQFVQQCCGIKGITPPSAWSQYEAQRWHGGIIYKIPSSPVVEVLALELGQEQVRGTFRYQMKGCGPFCDFFRALSGVLTRSGRTLLTGPGWIFVEIGTAHPIDTWSPVLSSTFQWSLQKNWHLTWLQRCGINAQCPDSLSGR